jgi:hypothetical protein
MIRLKGRIDEINVELTQLKNRINVLETEKQLLCIWCSQHLKEEDRCEHFTLHKTCCYSLPIDDKIFLDGWHNYIYR